MCRAAPRLVTCRTLERILPVELAEVATVHGDLIGAGRIGRAVVLLRLGQDDRLGAVHRVIGDGRHLIHVLGRRVDRRIIRVEIARDDRIAPVILEERKDALGFLGLATVDELPLLVVAELDLLGGAERL